MRYLSRASPVGCANPGCAFCFPSAPQPSSKNGGRTKVKTEPPLAHDRRPSIKNLLSNRRHLPAPEPDSSANRRNPGILVSQDLHPITPVAGTADAEIIALEEEVKRDLSPSLHSNGGSGAAPGGGAAAGAVAEVAVPDVAPEVAAVKAFQDLEVPVEQHEVHRRVSGSWGGQEQRAGGGCRRRSRS